MVYIEDTLYIYSSVNCAFSYVWPSKYNVGARVILVVVFLPFYSAGLQVGWYFELAAFSTTSIKCL
jgi:hypothetical protein